MKEFYAKILTSLLRGKSTSRKTVRCQTGIQPVDALLSGGFASGISVIAGGISSGKTILALSLLEDVQRNVIIVSFDENEAEVSALAKKYSPGLEKHSRQVYIPRGLVDYPAIFKSLAGILKAAKNSIVLINSLSSGGDAYKDGRKEFYDALQSLAKLTGSSMIVCYETDKEFCLPSGPIPLDPLFELSESVLFVNYRTENGDVSRSLFSARARGNSSSKTVLEFKIGEEPLEFYEKEHEPAGPRGTETIKAGVSTTDIYLDTYLAQEFNRTHADANLEVINLPISAAGKNTKLAQMFLETDYDIGSWVVSMVHMGMKLGELRPVSNAFIYEEIKNYYPAVLEALNNNAIQYCTPVSASVVCHLYRKDIYSKHGIKVPETFGELREALKFIRRKEKGIKHALMYRQHGDGLVRLLLSHALSYDENGSGTPESLFVIDARYVKALSFMRDCMADGLVNKNIGEGPQYYSWNFIEGETASCFAEGYTGVSGLIVKNPSLKDKYGFTNLPVDRSGSRKYNPMEVSAYVIRKSPKSGLYFSEALKILTSQKVQLEVKRVGKSPELSCKRSINQEADDRFKCFENCHEIMGNSIHLGKVFAENNFVSILRDMAYDVLSGKAEPEEAVEAAIKKAGIWNKTKYYADGVAKAKLFIERQKNRKLGVSDVAGEVGLSVKYFEKIFKADTGETIGDYINKTRLENAKYLLENERGLNIKEVSTKCGYVNSAHFSTVFKRYAGMDPTEYRSRNNPIENK